MLAAAIAKHLDAAVPDVAYRPTSTGGNTFVAHMPDTPDLALMVMPTGGLEQFTRAPVDLPTVQLLARGEPGQPVPPYELLMACYGALACLDLTVLDPGGDDEVLVIACTPHQAGPVAIGRDPNQRHEWSANWRFRVHQPTTHRPEITA